MSTQAFEKNSKSLDLATFRMLVLRRALVAAMSVTVFVLVMVTIGSLKFPLPQIINNLAFLALSAGCYFALRLNDRSFPIVRFIHLSTLILFFTCGAIFYPDDRMGFAWFFICVGSAFLMAGTVAGIASTFASVCAIIVVRNITLTISADEAGTISCALICTSAIFCIFEKQTREFVMSLKVAAVQLHNLAHKDMLTDIPNRMAYEKVLSSILQMPKSCSLVMMDLDYFKKVNDVHGHLMGDQVLKSVASVLTTAVRSGDYAARIGGEEFVILLPDTDIEEAKRVAEHVRREVARTAISLHDVRLSVTASFGIATSAFAHLSVDELMRRADEALYQAKRDGRNCVRSFTADILQCA